MSQIISILPNANASVNVNAMTNEPQPIVFNKVGKSYSEPISVQDAIKDCGADYVVGKEPLIRVSQDVVDAIKRGEDFNLNLTKRNLITSHCATVDTTHNSTLGVVGAEYGCVQNDKAFEFINFIQEVSGQEPIVETCGVLYGGKKIFVSCRLGEDNFLNPDDAVRNYVVFTNSHDGSGAVQAFFTPIRVWCSNTLAFAIKGCKNKVIFKHTKNVNHRLDWEIEENRKKALEVFQKSAQFSDKFITQMLQWKEEVITHEQQKDFAARLFLDNAAYKLYELNNHDAEGVDEISTRAKNQIAALNASIESGIGQQVNRGTKLWLMNGLTTFLQNDSKYRSDEDKLKSIMEGTGAKRVQQAYDLLIAA